VEDIGTQTLNLEIVKRLVIILVFLSIFWFVLNYLATKIKSGDMKLPNFLRNKLYGGTEPSRELHKIELIQKKYLTDGAEMLVVDVDGSHILLARSINGSISYVKDLDTPNA
jgi:hypothetical protein